MSKKEALEKATKELNGKEKCRVTKCRKTFGVNSKAQFPSLATPAELAALDITKTK